MIDVIIPAYNAHDTLIKTLNSIIMQSCFPLLKVHIVNDNSDTDYSDIVLRYREHIFIEEMILDKNIGPGGAKNYAIDHTFEDFIIFVDSDDILFEHYAIEKLYNQINESDYDVVISNFLEEVDNGKYILHENENVWCHGKIYRRSFIKQNNIRFGTTKTNEDLYFNFLILLCSARSKYINDLCYVWKKNDKSLTRKNNYEYNYLAIGDYNYNINELFKKSFENEEVPFKSVQVLFFGLIEMYYTYLSFKTKKNDKLVEEVLKYTKKNAIEYQKYAKYLNFEDKNKILKKVIKKLMMCKYMCDYLLPNSTFYDFLDEVLNYDK